MEEPRWHRPRLLFRTILCTVLLVNSVQCSDSGEIVPNATKDSFSNYFSVKDSFFNGSDVAKCLNLNLVTCLKVSLLGKVTRLLELTKERQLEKSTDLMGGLVTLETTGEDCDVEDGGEGVDEEWDAAQPLDAAKEERLNELLLERLTAFFKDKRLTLKFIPGLTLRVFPAKTMKEFVRMTVQLSGENLQQVMARTMKMGGMMRSPWMLIGPMITLGMFPFMLANLKYMVMNAFMINNMALMMALRTTITNLVFGDGEGDNIVYRNKGYSNEYKDKPIDDHHGPIRYTVKPYNQINKYRKVYEPRPSSMHSQNGGDHFAAGSQNSFSVSSPKNSTRDEGFQPPVKYIAHHDYFGKRRPGVSLISRPRVPAGTKPVKYVEHHDYFGSTSRRPIVGEMVREPNNPVKYVGSNSFFHGGMSPVEAQRNNILARPNVGNQFSPTFYEDLNGKFEPSNDYLPNKFEHVKNENPVTTFSLQNSPFVPTYQESSFVINADGQDYLNNVNYNNHQSQVPSNHQNFNEIPPNHKLNEEISDYNYFGMQSRIDSPTPKKDTNTVDAKPAVKTPSAVTEISINHPMKLESKTEAPSVNTVVDRDQNSWVAKGDNDHWPIIYQDPTTFHQEAKIKTTEVGTVFPVFTGTVVAEPEAEIGPKHSVQVSSEIRFENAAPKIEAKVEIPGAGLGSGGYFGNGEVISVSPHEDSDPALRFQDSLDLSDENEFVNFPQRLIQVQPGQKIDRRIETESLEPETIQSNERLSQIIVGSAHEERNPSSFPESLWVFKD